MKLNLIETKEILDLEKEIGYELVVTERPDKDRYSTRLSMFYVSFERSNIIERGCSARRSGNGNTIDEALKDYCREVSCCKMVFDINTNKREDIQFPKLVHTKLIDQ